jgi:putative serine protease PepD
MATASDTRTPPRSDLRRSHFLAGLLGALVVALPILGLAIGGAFSSSSDGRVAAAPPPAAATPAPAAAPARSATDVSALYERVSPGVVSVEVQTAEGGGTGSGFVLDRDGYILTNDHVVDGAQTVRVRFADSGAGGVTARVAGVDPSTDLALLKIDPAGHKLTPLSLGSSKDLKVGQPAIAIGSPFRLEGTLTTGVISALGRSIQAPNNFTIDSVVQTDAAINPGNSGGPLLDASGRVVGINAQIATSTQSNSGVGFAIPIDTAKQVLAQLKAGQEIKRGYLGVETGDAATGTGAILAAVVPGGPADRAGLRAGDRVVSIAGRDVTESSDIATAVAAAKPGARIEVGVRRGDSRRTVTVKLGTRPARAGG